MFKLLSLEILNKYINFIDAKLKKNLGSLWVTSLRCEMSYIFELWDKD